MRRIIIIATLFFPAISGVFASLDGEEEARARFCLERAGMLYEQSRFDSLPCYYGFARDVFTRKGDHEGTAACMLGMVDYYRRMDLQAAAANLLDSAESFIRIKIGRDSESWADALFTRAKLFHSQNLQKEAITLLDSCLGLLERLGKSGEKTAHILNVMGAAYFNLGDLQRAEECYLTALQEYMNISRDPSVERGTLLFNLGLVYSLRGEYPRWLECIRQGIENNILLFGPEFPDLADNYNSLSSYFISSGQLDSARYYLDRAESIMVKAFGSDYYDLSRIYINRARVYRYTGNYHESLEYYRQALRILESQQIPNHSLSEVICINMGDLYAAMGEYDTALEYLLRLLDAEGRVHPGRMANYYIDLADIYLKKRDFDISRRYLELASGIRDMNPVSGRSERLYEYMLEAALMDSVRQREEAERFHRMALKTAQDAFGEYHYWTARAYKNLGDHFRAAGDPEPALEDYQKSLHSMVPGYEVKAVETNPDPGDVTDLLFYLEVLKQKAGLLEEMRDTVPAFDAYLNSVRVTEMLRNSYLTDESKLYLSGNERRTYEKAVRAAYQCYELTLDPKYLEEAFRVAEKGKYATLQSILHREQALDLTGIPDSVRRKESELQKQLAVYRALLREGWSDTLQDRIQLKLFEEEIFHLSDQIAHLHRTIERDYPDYYDLFFNQEVMDLHALRHKLGRKDRLIEYFMTERDLYVFEMSRKTLHCIRRPIDSLWIRDLNLVMDFITLGSLSDSMQDEHLAFIESAHRLYESLIPFPGDMKNLIIIPDGRLLYFPFDALITEPVPEFSGLYRDLPFLLRDHILRYGYSASLLYRKDKWNPGSLNRFVGFAPGYMAVEEKNDDVRSVREIIIDRDQLEALPGSVEEVTQIGRLLRGKVYTGKDATESCFKSTAGKGHVIHLATHAFIDDEDPLNSTLVFSKDPLEGEDGLLKVYELYNMELDARMVVLNTCNSGAGKMISGEGIMSLARAFYYAGVPGEVMTLWKVTDLQGHNLMLSFYDQLKKGKRADTALRRAKLEYLDNALPGDQHPRYWAGYIFMGKPEFFAYSGGPLRIAGILAAMVVLLLTGRYLLKRSRSPGS